MVKLFKLMRIIEEEKQEIINNDTEQFSNENFEPT